MPLHYMDVSISQLLKENKTSELIALLEENSELLQSRDSNGASLLLRSVYFGNSALKDFLVQKIPSLDLYEAVAVGDLKRVREIIRDEKSLLNTHSPDGFTALGLACYFGRKDVVKYLLHEGADPNIASSNAFHVSPIHSATSSGHLEIAKMLLKAGADVNAMQQKRITPLHGAAHRGDLEMVKVYLEHGAKLFMTSEDGKSVFDYASESGRESLMYFLDSFKHGDSPDRT